MALTYKPIQPELIKYGEMEINNQECVMRANLLMGEICAYITILLLWTVCSLMT